MQTKINGNSPMTMLLACTMVRKTLAERAQREVLGGLADAADVLRICDNLVEHMS